MQLNLFAQKGWNLIDTFPQGIGCIFFNDALNGYLFLSSAEVYKTSDGGENWGTYNIPNLNSAIFKIIVLGNTYLIGIGSGGTVIKSTDLGETWEIKNVAVSDNFTDVSSTIDGKLYIISYEKKIFKSTDNGNNWSIYSLDTMYFPLTSISFSNSNVGYGVGYYQTSIKTTDGGENWFAIPPIIQGCSMFAIEFINENIGYTLGGDEIDKTTNGGITWEKIYDPIYGGGQLNDITTFGNNFVWVVGSDKILHTTNAGETWNPQSYTPYIYLGRTESIDSLICFVWAEGNLYKTTNGGYLTNIEDSKSRINDYILLQNYPNPFNPSTKISWQSPVGSWQTLKVYDVLGNKVATLVDEFKTAGSYEVEFNPSSIKHHPSSGIYFYRLQAGDYVETKKMILLK